MKWEKIDHRSWFQQITEDIYRVLIVQEYLNGVTKENTKNFGIKVMTVDVIKQEKEIEQLQKRYKIPLLEHALGEKGFVKANRAKLYAFVNGKSLVRVGETDYKILVSHVKKYYGLNIEG